MIMKTPRRVNLLKTGDADRFAQAQVACGLVRILEPDVKNRYRPCQVADLAPEPAEIFADPLSQVHVRHNQNPPPRNLVADATIGDGRPPYEVRGRSVDNGWAEPCRSTVAGYAPNFPIMPAVPIKPAVRT